MTTDIFGLHETNIEQKLIDRLSKKALYCSQCGYVLLKDRIRCEHDLFIIAKCSNKSCRNINRFVFVENKIKLLTKKLVNKTPEEYWLPYSKNDMLEWILD